MQRKITVLNKTILRDASYSSGCCYNCIHMQRHDMLPFEHLPFEQHSTKYITHFDSFNHHKNTGINDVVLSLQEHS
jgi:hypothetical protein